MLGVGLDWAEDHHDVALGLPGKGVTEQFRIEHGPAGSPPGSEVKEWAPSVERKPVTDAI